MKARLAAALFGSFTMASGCQLLSSEPVPAVLADDDAETMATLKSALAEAVGRANVELGPGDLTTTSVVSVLPPPLSALETASVAMPTQFTLMLRGDTCMAVHSETGEEFAMDVACKPA